MIDKSLLIGVDASRAVLETKTGTEHYSWEIINGLLKLNSPHRFRLYAPSQSDGIRLSSNSEWKIIPQQRLWSQIALAREVNTSKPDILFIPSHVLPFRAKVKSVVTIHDVAYKIFPEAYGLPQRLYLDITTKHSLRKASKVIVPSNATKNDVVKFYGVNKEKIDVIPHGYNQQFNTSSQDVPSSPHPFKYFFFIGRIESKKNINLLINAFSIFSQSNSEIHLVLAGKPGIGSNEIMKNYRSLNADVKDRIHFVGYLDQEAVAAHMRNCQAFVFPSLYEGFGIPLLEAMASGVPIISSNTPALLEVGDGVAIFANSSDPQAWSNAMNKVSSSEHTKEMVSAGYQKLSEYSWEKSAERTLETIENAAQ